MMFRLTTLTVGSDIAVISANASANRFKYVSYELDPARGIGRTCFSASIIFTQILFFRLSLLLKPPLNLGFTPTLLPN